MANSQGPVRRPLPLVLVLVGIIYIVLGLVLLSNSRGARLVSSQAAVPVLPAADATSIPQIIATSLAAEIQSGISVEGDSQPVQRIEIVPPLPEWDPQLSGLAWYGDRLILLPQMPSDQGGLVYGLDKSDILGYLDGRIQSPLTLHLIPFRESRIEDSVRGFDGFEAIAFEGNRVFLTVEAEEPDRMVSYLVEGLVAPDGGQILIDPNKLTAIEAQANVQEAGDETLIIVDDLLLTVYEVNDSRATENPVGHVFDKSLDAVGTVPFTPIDWRITDATELDGLGRFWAINTSYFLLASEQLVEFEVGEQGITRTEQAPIPLALEDESRNWEGVARLDERGFLIATDRHPETILAFVPRP